MLKHALTLLLLFVMTCTAHWAWAQPTEQALADLAGQAYIFGYPLLTMDASMRTMSAPEAPGGPSLVNRFSHKPAFPDPGFTDVVSPNADTLYSIAWLDLKGSPMVFSLPEMAERYYLMQLIDGWTNDFISLGTRSTGNRPGEYLIAGPGWQGKLPEGMRLIKAPGNMVWILGRIQTNGTADYAAVQALQQRFVLRPLLENAASPAVPKPDKGSPLEQVEGLNAQDFFARLNRLMLDTPPACDDKPLLDKLAALSIGPGLTFDLAALPAPVAEAVRSGHRQARDRLITQDRAAFGQQVGGWNIPSAKTGRFGTDYTFRAFIARYGLGANLPEDALYPATDKDSEGAPLNGANSYSVRFTPGELPPVKAFWSITMYDDKQRFVDNSLARYAIGDRDPLLPDPDGGLTIIVQHTAPGPEKEANWLPAPEGDCNLMMRLYWPEEAILKGKWPLPVVKKNTP